MKMEHFLKQTTVKIKESLKKNQSSSFNLGSFFMGPGLVEGLDGFDRVFAALTFLELLTSTG